MKFLIPLILSTSAFAAQLEVTEYDQARLALFLNKLPANIVEKNEESFTGHRKVKMIFAKKGSPIRIECASEYYDPAPVPSESLCTFAIDINHQSIEKHYDEVRTSEEDVETAKALYEVMNYGTETRSFRSGEFEEGTDFDGHRTNIFSFLFECTQKSCLYRFSEKMIK